MNTKIFILFLIIILLTNIEGKSQHLPQFSQYMMNHYLTNPAVPGTYKNYRIKTHYRYQWITANDAPHSIVVSMYGPFDKYDMGYGFLLYSDNTGPTSRLGFYGSYAYNIPVGEEYHLSFGASLGLVQYKISNIDLGDDIIDVAIIKKPVYRPDANFGVYLSSTNFYAGIAAFQLIGSKLDVFDDPADTTYIGFMRLLRHYYASVGYIYRFKKRRNVFYLEPTFIVNRTPFYIKNMKSTMIYDLSCKLTVNKEYWVGLSYKNLRTIALMGGYIYDKRYEIGLCYEYSFDKTRYVSSGSIEVMIGYLFDNLQKKR
jgi:type IX secretion system PorP/SprF family membrane protein